MGAEPPHWKFKSWPATTFIECVADVTFNRADAHHQPGSNSSIAKPLQEELDHGDFCGGEGLLSHGFWNCFQNHSPFNQIWDWLMQPVDETASWQQGPLHDLRFPGSHRLPPDQCQRT